MEKEELFAKAEELGNKWKDSLDLSGDHNPDKALEALQGRTWDGEPVLALIARDPEEASQKCVEGVATILFDKSPEDLTEDQRKQVEDKLRELRPQSAVWDYYLMAFYESAMGAAGLSHQLTDQTLLPAFQAGVGFIINLGCLMVGVLLPEAHRDEEFRLHRADGPALVWGAIKEYWWHGVSVKEEWILHPEKIDPSELLKESNAETRRAGIEILGWDKILALLDSRVIDEDQDPMIGTLIEVDLPEAPNSRFLKVLCGTGRFFFMPVPQEMQTALQANSWSYDIEPAIFKNYELRT